MDSKKRKVEDEENVSSMEDSISPDDLSQLLEPLSKEQLSSILKKACLSHPDVLTEVRKIADEDPASRKLFVRGLSWTTNGDILKRSFEKYGVVDEAVVINDKNSGKSKGFGFVTFKHRDAAIRALKEPSKKIEGRMTVCHLSGSARDASATASTPSGAGSQVYSESVASRKIYVGNVPKNMQAGALLEFFSQFGEVEEGPLGFDRETGKCKGFALFIYKTSLAAKKCLESPVKKINGHQVQCKLAESQRNKDDGSNLTSSSSFLGYDLTSPAAIAAYNPSFLQTNTTGLGTLGQSFLPQTGLSSFGLHGIDPLGSRGSSHLAPDPVLGSSSFASLYGLPPTSQSSLLQNSRGHPSLTSLHSNPASGYNPSLHRSSFY